MHRLLVEPSLLDAQTVMPPKDAARHLKVLRPKPGEEIELFDGQGRTRVFKWCATDGTLTDPGAVTPHPAPAELLTLFACVTKGSRWGASHIGAVHSAPCARRTRGEGGALAARCGRRRPPERRRMAAGNPRAR